MRMKNYKNPQVRNIYKVLMYFLNTRAAHHSVFIKLYMTYSLEDNSLLYLKHLQTFYCCCKYVRASLTANAWTVDVLQLYMDSYRCSR